MIQHGDPNQLLDLMPLTRTLGADFSKYARDEVRARLLWAPGLCTVNGLLHGGT